MAEHDESGRAEQQATPAGAGAATAGPATDPDRTGPGEEEGAQLDQLDRRLSTRTYAGGAALVLALAAAIVAIVLAVDARDNSARKNEVRRLEQQLAAVAEQAGASSETQQDVESLGERVDGLEDEVDGLSSSDREIEKRLDVIEDDIEDLRQQISELDSGSSGGGSSGGDR
jgi:septal ring factor EnvC (AmiA/AmiB activator)